MHGVRRDAALFESHNALREAVIHAAVRPTKVSEAFNLADIFTKYVRLDKWRRHLTRLLNSD